MPHTHDLDSQVVEYFEFKVKGHQYRFRHMTTEEMQQLKGIENDEKKAQEFLYQFITPVEDKSPAFEEIAKQMLAPHWIAFRKMIEKEFGG